jgi:hypothetical protein
MRDLTQMAPDEIIRIYCAEKRRRESPPSIQGLDPDAPREKAPQSGIWEELLALTRGCDSATLAIMYEASGAWRIMATGWHCTVDGCGQWVDHKHSDVVGTDGNPLMSGGRPITEPVCNAVPATALAKKYGMREATLKKRIAGVMEQVAENIGRRRGPRSRYEGVTVEDTRALARVVLR